MDLNPVKDAFDRVTKKQKLSSSKAQEVIDTIKQETERALETIISKQPSHDSNHKSSLIELNKKLQETTPLSQLEPTQKDLNVALNKYTKQLEKSFNPDISKAYRNIEFDSHTLNQIIASHFYQQGLFNIGDCFIKESDQSESTAGLKSLFSELHLIVEAVKNRNLQPALNWVTSNSNNLKDNGSDLQLKLHRLQFIEILRNGNRNEALAYIRSNIAPFASKNLTEVQKLTACLLWARKLDQSPYSDLLSPTNWNKVAEDLTKNFCNLVGRSSESPLGVTIGAGFQGLPPLLKFMSVMLGKRNEWQTMKQLPVPVELDKEFQFHSLFVCPVSKEQSSEENPPMLMSCGHVLCKQSVSKMSKNGSKSFKCPYCPTDIEGGQCRQLHF